jgi:hypothetical protein
MGGSIFKIAFRKSNAQKLAATCLHVGLALFQVLESTFKDHIVNVMQFNPKSVWLGHGR